MSVNFNNAETEARLRAAASRGIVRGTEAVRNEVLRLILETAKTGRIYRRRGVSHQASAPGEAPASDTGTLVSRIRTDYSRLSELVGIVRSSAAYAAALEYGTARMEPRPHMRVSLATQRDNIRRGIREEIAQEFPRGS